MFQFPHILPTIAIWVSACHLLSANQSELKQKEGVSVQLVSAARSITPGETLTVGLILKPEEGYHTYWKGPGIVGVATSLTWELPDGFSAGEIIWPAPERVDMVGINAHGYSQRTCLLTKIEVPKNVKGDEVTLKAEAAWMCCATSCYPGFTDLSLTLPVNRSKNEPTFDPEYAQLFEQVRDSVPPLAPNDWTISARLVTPEVIELLLTIPGMQNSETNGIYFFADDLQVHSDVKQEVTLTDAPEPTLKIVLGRSDFAPANPPALSGVVFHPKGWPGLDSNYAEIAFPWPPDTFQP